MKPPHKHFFSSLKQVEKRLKLDTGDLPPPPPPSPPPSPPPPPQPQTQTQSTESSFNSSPLYFHNCHTNTCSTLNNSIDHPPHEFLSINDSHPNPNNQLNNNPENSFSQNDAVGGVETMIDLLRLSDFDSKGSQMPDLAHDEFYEKVVKVKGPKCKKEVDRLNGWVTYFLDSETEPFRLAHLLLAKAAVVDGGGDGDGDGDVLEFPSTVDDFLHNDPPDEGGRQLESCS